MLMNRNFSNAVNICADGLIDVITDNYENAEEMIDEWIGKYLDNTAIGIMAFNVNYHVSYIPSEVWDTAWKKTNGAVVTADMLKAKKHWGYKFAAAHDMGIEPYSIAIRNTHKRGAEAWFSVRMNEYHYLQNDLATASFWLEHPEYRIGENEPFDYSHKEVRDYYLAYIRELCEKYDIDGIELDMLRGPVFFGAAAKINLLTDFIREIREEITKIGRRKNKKIRMSARVYLNNKKCIEAGYDAAEWGRKGFVDILTLSNFFVPTTYYAPVKEWRCLMENSSCKINIATDFCSYCTKWDEPYTRYLKNNTKTLKGFAANAFFEGADGIYTFNVMLSGFTKDVDLDLKVDFREFSDYESAVSGERTHIYTYDEQFEDVVNLPLKKGKIYINTASRPDKLYNVLIGVNGDNIPKCSVGGKECRFVGKETGNKYNPDIKNPPQVHDVSETAKNVCIFESEDFLDINEGKNEIAFECIDDVVWIQVNVD